MLLHSLITQFDPHLSLAGIPDVHIHRIREDSRLIARGDLFVARSGTRTDGAKFLQDAQSRGAVAAVVAAKVPDVTLPQIVISDAAAAASKLAHLLLVRPSSTVRVLGITGTNGKTTTAYLVRHLLSQFNRRCGMIGTVEIDDGQACREASMTTPAAGEIAELLAAMRDNGCGACAMEVSSHAMDQGRVAGVEFAAAAFTNLTGDHLDYHKSEENYAAAKAKLFGMLAPSAVAVVNADDPAAAKMLVRCQARVVRFGFAAAADYRAADARVTQDGSTFILHTPDGQTEVEMQLIGRHNIQNALAAAAIVGETFGLTVHQIAAGLRDALGAPGRLQPIRVGQPFAVFVDYAHTDDGLENVLSALKPITRGKLRTLFGCGGDRDRTKRPRMAHIAERLADVIYVTSDNPRTEDPAGILDEIIAGLSPAARSAAVVESDRRAAIERILSDANPGDVVLLAGKGHENYQIIGTEKRHFDDVEETQRILSQRTFDV